MTTWTPDEIREREAALLSADERERFIRRYFPREWILEQLYKVEQFDGGTERDKRDEYWLTVFYAVFILASAIGAGALLNAYLPVPGVF